MKGGGSFGNFGGEGTHNRNPHFCLPSPKPSRRPPPSPSDFSSSSAARHKPYSSATCTVTLLPNTAATIYPAAPFEFFLLLKPKRRRPSFFFSFFLPGRYKQPSRSPFLFTFPVLSIGINAAPSSSQPQPRPLLADLAIALLPTAASPSIDLPSTAPPPKPQSRRP